MIVKILSKKQARRFKFPSVPRNNTIQKLRHLDLLLIIFMQS